MSTVTRTKTTTMDRINPMQVMEWYGNLQGLKVVLDAAEDQAMAELAKVDFVHDQERLVVASEVQGKIERVRQAAVREFALLTWGREVNFGA